jgi:hypothetical protein
MSIASAVRAEQFEALKRLTVEERIKLAFELGRRDLALFAAAQSLSVTEARHRLKSQRKTGRWKSASADK